MQAKAVGLHEMHGCVTAGAESEIGDVSTLADPGVVSELIAQRGK